MATNDVMYREENGITSYSLDGSKWLSQAEYENQYPSTKTEWWTYEEYATWIDEQREYLNSLIDTGDGWYDGQGIYHTWTKESVDEEIAEYEKILADIKTGMLYSKDNGDGDTFAQSPPSDKVENAYSVDVKKTDGETLHFGVYSTEQALDNAIKQAVADGTLTQSEADSAMSK